MNCELKRAGIPRSSPSRGSWMRCKTVLKDWKHRFRASEAGQKDCDCLCECRDIPNSRNTKRCPPDSDTIIPECGAAASRSAHAGAWRGHDAPAREARPPARCDEQCVRPTWTTDEVVVSRKQASVLLDGASGFSTSLMALFSNTDCP